jgi:hypothetical protein
MMAMAAEKPVLPLFRQRQAQEQDLMKPIEKLLADGRGGK